MAGDWIKIRKSLTRDPRVVRISSALNADRLRTIGGLVSAWCLLDEQTEDGKLDGYTPEIFDEIVGVPGIAAAMAAVNWLEIQDGFLAAPRFEEHNGHSAKRRAQENVRKMSARDADKCPQPKQTKSAPEKRREEKRNNTDKHSLAVAIYERYPRKVGKKAALDAINKALKEKDPTELLAAVNRFAASQRDTEERFIPHPATWFNRGSYDDEESPAQTQRTKDW